MIRFVAPGPINAGDKLSVDGGTQFFFKDDTGGTTSQFFVTWPLPAGTYAACFTTATSQGAVSPGQWRVLLFPFFGVAGGMINYVLGLVQDAITFLHTNYPALQYLLYEFGQQMTGGGQNPLDERTLYQAANRDSRMYDVITKHMNNLAGLAHAPTVACFTNDITFYGTAPTTGDSWYGALENSGDPTTSPNVPKYRALVDFIASRLPATVTVPFFGTLSFRLHS
jgi:hypothetical protein